MTGEQPLLCPVCGQNLLRWRRILEGGGVNFGLMCPDPGCVITSALCDSEAEALAALKEKSEESK